MFDVKARAEIKNLNVRRQTHGDEFVPADDIKLLLMAVSIDKISSTGNLGLLYDEHGQVALGELNPFTVHHELKNLDVTIGAVALKGVSIKKKAKLTLLPDRLANVECQVVVPEITDADHAGLRAMYIDGDAQVEIIENQAHIDDMEQ